MQAWKIFLSQWPNRAVSLTCKQLSLLRTVRTIPARLQTKSWRMSALWYRDGKRNECEIYQRALIELITQSKCIKTNFRINIATNQLLPKSFPMKHDDGFEWTEDFDGLIIVHARKYYFNLKMVCDAGGAQTRTLREVYHFIKAQLAIRDDNVVFINILDGNTSYSQMAKFNYLTGRYIGQKIFVGDMHDFQSWWHNQI